MTREKAINLEAEVRYSLTASKHKAAVDIAFAALREQEERSKGCEFCQNRNSDTLWEAGGPHEFRLHQDGLFCFDTNYGWEGTTVRFCPMCVKLGVEG